MQTTNRPQGIRTPAEVFVISDLHIGGEYGANTTDRGFRINTHLAQLTSFVHEIQQRAQQTGKFTELVINGDFVDFLAEDGPTESSWRSFIADQDEASVTLDRIVRRDQPFFTALQSLMQSGVMLTVILGNHDVELSLPAVRARLRTHLGAGPNALFQFVYDGEAYVIGDVLIEHGNRYDGWNVLDFDCLRRFRSESSRRLKISAEAQFTSPAGSKLVQEVMNPIKKSYGFVDLLKPETATVIPLLLTLEPSYVRKIRSAGSAFIKAQRHQPQAPARPAYAGEINAEQDTTLTEILAQRLNQEEQNQLLAFINEVELEMQANAAEIAGGGISGYIRSFAQMMRDKVDALRLDLLHSALRRLQDDKSFDWQEETDPNYLQAAQELTAQGFAAIVFGHTHLAKDIALKGGGKYLNTGTWADLMRVPEAIITGTSDLALPQLQKFVQAVRENSFAEYIEFIPTFAHLTLDEEGKMSEAAVRNYEPGCVKEL